jgi:UDP-N-acetyl-D-glucosamine dehydrogenase
MGQTAPLLPPKNKGIISRSFKQLKGLTMTAPVAPHSSSPATTALLGKIARREAVASVVGLGYVGLPLAVALAQAGLQVVGIDLDAAKVAQIRHGQSYVGDVPAAAVAAEVGAGRLRATTDYAILCEVDIIIICVPTPLSKTRDPDISYIVHAADQIERHFRPGQLVILESTTYPGTTEEILLPRLSRNGHHVGEDFFLAFSPERIDPGNQLYHLRNTPKVVGGLTPSCQAVAMALYGLVVERLIPVSNPKTAEMAKLLENIFRAVNIGLINEVALMCARLGISVWEVIEAASTKPYGFMPFYPGPGLGGHCIPLDPYYLSWKLRTLNYNARFIELAGEVNTSMPHYVVDLVSDALNARRKAVNGARVLILGVAYKANVADVRESPAIDVLRLLRQKGALLHYNDPYVPELALGDFTLESTPLSEALLGEMDCVAIITPHATYDWAQIVAQAPLIIDTRNATRALGDASPHVVKL